MFFFFVQIGHFEMPFDILCLTIRGVSFHNRLIIEIIPYKLYILNCN